MNGQVQVSLSKSKLENVKAHPLWVAIRERTQAIRFQKHHEFIERVFCKEGNATGEEAACQPCQQPERAQGELSEGTRFPPVQPQTVAPGVSPPVPNAPPSTDKCKTFRERFDCDREALGHLTHGANAYQLLKTATEIFLLLECGVVVKPPKDKTKGTYTRSCDEIPNDPDLIRIPDDLPAEDFPITFEKICEKLRTYLPSSGTSPYVDTIVRQVFGDPSSYAKMSLCEGLLEDRVKCPCMLELIWSYWHEEGMLAQTLSAISLRFQNRRYPGKKVDPLGELEIDPLRGLNHLLWGYIQDEQHRLTVRRRTYEYDHHYGLSLLGKAVPTLQSADSRSKFIEAFHHLLHRCAIFFQEDADTTVISDGFPLLNALKEVHLVLAQGAHNQFGDLPWTARVEMLIQQWLLARPEVREFLRGRIMVPYPEEWMGRVDAMNKLQGWTDSSVIHFRDLGTFGEALLLSIRHQKWIEITDQEEARTWVRYWRPEIQGYLHAYRVVTGVDLAAELTTMGGVDATLPAIHLQNRLAVQRRRTATSKSA